MSKTILLADDSVTIQKVIELTFMDQNYEVVPVSSGDDALARLGEMTPDLVIADVHMPGANGYEVARQSKARLPGVPVLLLVGTFEEFDDGEYAACGADDYLKKPFDSQELLRLVEQLSGDAAAAEPAQAAAPVAAAAPPPAPPVPPPPIDPLPPLDDDLSGFSLDDDPMDSSSLVMPPPDLAAAPEPAVAEDPFLQADASPAPPSPAPPSPAPPAIAPPAPAPPAMGEAADSPAFSVDLSEGDSSSQVQPPADLPEPAIAAGVEAIAFEEPTLDDVAEVATDTDPAAPAPSGVEAIPFDLDETGTFAPTVTAAEQQAEAAASEEALAFEEDAYSFEPPDGLTRGDVSAMATPDVEAAPDVEFDTDIQVEAEVELEAEVEAKTPAFEVPQLKVPTMAALAESAPAQTSTEPEALEVDLDDIDVSADAEDVFAAEPAEVEPEVTPEVASAEDLAAAGPGTVEPTSEEPVTEQPVAAAHSTGGNGQLSDDDVDRIARRVVELMGEKMARELAWEIIPDLAEVVIKDRLRELENQLA